MPHIDVAFEGIDEASFSNLLPLIDKAVRKTVETAELEFEEGAELSVLITGDDRITKLNAQWRGKDNPTNVLSFPGENLSPGDSGGNFLGDIAVSVETTQRESELENKSFDDHFTHLIIHGFLHVFGYDHESEEQARQMEGLETKILGQLGVSDPYESE